LKFSELIYLRQSVRRYSGRQVEKEKLLQCLDAARLAPSASNSQPWTFIVVDEPSLKDQVAHATFSAVLRFNKFAMQAPVIIVIVEETPKIITQIGERVKKKEWPLIDIGIAAGHICLQAAELGLGTCMIGWYNEKKVKALLGIPERSTIGLIITLGYPSDGYPVRKKIRKRLEKIISYNRYHAEQS
jgi:nitroreductase